MADMFSDVNPLNWLANLTQAYNIPVIGGAFENPQTADKVKTMLASGKYYQQQRPEQVQTQMNMLNNQLAAYQPMADVMASLGLPTEGVQYAGANPFGPSAYGGWTGMDMPEATNYPGPAAQQQQNFDDLSHKSQPNFFGLGGSHPERQTVPDWYDEAGNLHSVQKQPDGNYAEMVYDPITGLPIQKGVGPNATYYSQGKPVTNYPGSGNVGANDQGRLKP
jgi:hypothetical protein